jgi:hypothetical protein
LLLAAKSKSLLLLLLLLLRLLRLLKHKSRCLPSRLLKLLLLLPLLQLLRLPRRSTNSQLFDMKACQGNLAGFFCSFMIPANSVAAMLLRLLVAKKCG